MIVTVSVLSNYLIKLIVLAQLKLLEKVRSYNVNNQSDYLKQNYTSTDTGIGYTETEADRYMNDDMSSESIHVTTDTSSNSSSYYGNDYNGISKTEDHRSLLENREVPQKDSCI